VNYSSRIVKIVDRGLTMAVSLAPLLMIIVATGLFKPSQASGAWPAALMERWKSRNESGAESQKHTSVPLISTQELLHEIGENRLKVPEFQFLSQLGQELNVKIYLFGGTAAAFAHYVKWDFLRRERDDHSYFPDRFDYKYVNIYRASQDLDIVVDGPKSAIDEIAARLSQAFPYLQGNKSSKSSWEVRSLREDSGDKLALLNNDDFLNQHSDSNSVGLIEVTEPGPGELIVRDLFDWNNSVEPQFLKDVVEGKIRFYFSKKHATTAYFIQGRNPPIISVIRYFIKCFQFDLSTRAEDLPVIKKIISEFEPSSIDDQDYLKSWFKNNVPKLVQNSIDIEKSFQVLQAAGLLEKLRRIGAPEKEGTPAWWMNKQPLLSYKLGQRDQIIPGPTAAELGLSEVAHETTSYSVYESLTRSHKGIPNVLISRVGKVGESAVHGDGFYTMKGHNSGYRGTGFTVRFKVSPMARLNTDFSLVKNTNFVIFHNRNAIEVIPENLKLDLISYYQILLHGESLSNHDKGLLYRLQLALRSNFFAPTEAEIQFVLGLHDEEFLRLIQLDRFPESGTFLSSFLPRRTFSQSHLLEMIQTTAAGGSPALSEEVKRALVEKILNSDINVHFLVSMMELKIFDQCLERFFEKAAQQIYSDELAAFFLTAWSERLKKDSWLVYPLVSDLEKVRRIQQQFESLMVRVLQQRPGLSPLGKALELFTRIYLGRVVPSTDGSFDLLSRLILKATNDLNGVMMLLKCLSILPNYRTRFIDLWPNLKDKALGMTPNESELAKFAELVPIKSNLIELANYGIDHSVFHSYEFIDYFITELDYLERHTSKSEPNSTLIAATLIKLRKLVEVKHRYSIQISKSLMELNGDDSAQFDFQGEHLTEAIVGSQDPQQQAHFLKIGMDRRLFTRSLQLAQILQWMIPIEGVDLSSLYARAWEQFIALKSTINQVLAVSGGRSQIDFDAQLALYFKNHFSIDSDDHLVRTLQAFKKFEKRNQFVIEHLDQIQNVYFRSHVLKSLGPLLDYGFGFHHLLNISFEQSRGQNGRLILHLMDAKGDHGYFDSRSYQSPFAPPAHQSALLMEVWKKALHSLPKEAKATLRKQKVLLRSCFSLESYKEYLTDMVETSDSLVQIATSPFEEQSNINVESIENQFYPISSRAKIREIHESFFIKLLSQNALRLAAQRVDQSPLRPTIVNDFLSRFREWKAQKVILDMSFSSGVSPSVQEDLMASRLPGVERFPAVSYKELRNYYLENLLTVLSPQNELGLHGLMRLRDFIVSGLKNVASEPSEGLNKNLNLALAVNEVILFKVFSILVTNEAQHQSERQMGIVSDKAWDSLIKGLPSTWRQPFEKQKMKFAASRYPFAPNESKIPRTLKSLKGLLMPSKSKIGNDQSPFDEAFEQSKWRYQEVLSGSEPKAIGVLNGLTDEKRRNGGFEKKSCAKALL
jgi:hypothetical protein